MRKIDTDIKQRCSEELRRVFCDHINLAHLCGFQVRQTLPWWYGETVPSATSMRILDTHGIDIYYIITGKRMVTTDV